SEICSDLKRLKRDTESHKHATVATGIDQPEALTLTPAAPAARAAGISRLEKDQTPVVQSEARRSQTAADSHALEAPTRGISEIKRYIIPLTIAISLLVIASAGVA